MLYPVPRVPCLLVPDPASRHVRDEPLLRCFQLHLLHLLQKRPHHRLDQTAMKRMRGPQPLVLHSPHLQLSFHLFDLFHPPRQHAHPRRIHRRYGKSLLFRPSQLFFSQRYRHHPSTFHLLHQPSSRRYHPQHLFPTHHSRYTRCRILSHAVPQHRFRLHSPTLPQLHQPILHRHQRRLRQICLIHLRRSLLIQCPAQVRSQMRLQNLTALLQAPPEHPFVFIQFGSHPCILVPLPGEQKSHFPPPLLHSSFTPGCQLPAQLLYCFFPAAAHSTPPPPKHLPSYLQRVPHIRQLCCLFLLLRLLRLQILQQVLHPLLQGLFCPRRARQHMPAASFLPGPGLRRFFHHHMRVGPAHTKGAHSRTPWSALSLPLLQLRVDVKRTVPEIDLRIGFFIVQAGRQHPVFQAQHYLDQPGYSGCRIQMAHVGLDRAQRAESLPLGRRPKRFA